MVLSFLHIAQLVKVCLTKALFYFHVYNKTAFVCGDISFLQHHLLTPILITGDKDLGSRFKLWFRNVKLFFFVFVCLLELASILRTPPLIWHVEFNLGWKQESIKSSVENPKQVKSQNILREAFGLECTSIPLVRYYNMWCYVEINSGSCDWLDLARLTLNVELKNVFPDPNICSR